MPIYEFHCDACDADSEILVRSSDWKGTRCPKCGSTRLAKRLSVFASSAGGAGDSGGSSGADCSGTPSSCMRCCGGGPHRH